MERLEKFLARLGRRIFACAMFLKYYRIGKGHGYPTCCVLHFSFDAARRKPPAIRRGTITVSHKSMYVPCIFHKGRDPRWKRFGERSPNQLQLFKETPRETHDRRRREREREARYSGRGFGRPYRVR